MGCCVSTGQKRHGPNNFPCISKSPPRPEEESVKEILSEFPGSKPEPGFKPTHMEPDDLLPECLKPTPIYTPKKPTFKAQHRPISHGPTVSDVSELSEVVSTEDHDEVLQRVCSCNNNNNSFNDPRSLQGQNGHFVYKKKRSFSGGTSPVRRSDPSPTRIRNPSGRRVDGYGRGDSMDWSRSPGTRSNVGRNPSGWRAGPSPGRVRMVHGPESGNEGKKGNDNEWKGPSESLDNPLVSLECFIFL